MNQRKIILVILAGLLFPVSSALAQNGLPTSAADPRIPSEVKYKVGYVNAAPIPRGFNSAMLWGIAIADTRVAGYESAEVEIAWTQLSCRVNGKDIVLNDDHGNVRGGLYRRIPWFGTDEHEPMPMEYGQADHSVVLRVGQRPDRVWHFWAASPRATLPPGKLEGCTVKARARISKGALVQIGMDYWRSATVPYGSETITKRGQALSISLRHSGRRLHSLILAGPGSSAVPGKPGSGSV